MYLQLAAYVRAVEEQENLPAIDGAILLHVNADVRSGLAGVKIILRTPEEIGSDFDDFLAVQKIWKRENETTKPKIQNLSKYLTFNQSPLKENENGLHP